MKKPKTALIDATTRRDAAIADEAAAREAISKLETDRGACIRRGGSDDDLDRIEASIKSEQRRAERAAARVEVLAVEVEQETRRAAEGEQREREAQANAVADAAGQKLAAAFDQIRILLHDALRAAAEADLLIEAANRGIGADRSPLPTVEARARARDPIPRRVISETEVTAWVFAESGDRLRDEYTARVRVGRDGRGFLPTDGGNYPGGVTPPPAIVEQRRFIKRTFTPAQRFPMPDDLATSLSIPGFRAGDAPIWEPIDFASPDAVLERLTAIEKQQVPDQRTEPEVEFVRIEESNASAA